MWSRINCHISIELKFFFDFLLSSAGFDTARPAAATR